MLDGKPVPSNICIIESGAGVRMMGVPRDIRLGLTHFKAKP